MTKKKVPGKVKEAKNLETFYGNWYVEKIAKNFTLQDDENLCIFVTKDKRQTIILTMSYIEQVLEAKGVWNFLSLIVIFKLFQRLKNMGLMTPRKFHWNTQYSNKLELNVEIIARTQDIQDAWNFHLFRKAFYG